MNMQSDVPEQASNAVLVQSEEMPANATKVTGYDFNQGVNYSQLFQAYRCMGFQATSLGKAIDEINNMVINQPLFCSSTPYFSTQLDWKPAAGEPQVDEAGQPIKCKIFLGYTSNLVSSGLRETIRFLVQHKMVRVHHFCFLISSLTFGVISKLQR
jgi:deoxyhypusine synthase